MKNYNSNDERVEVSKFFTIINEFRFEQISPMLIWERKKTMKEVHLLQNLIQWDVVEFLEMDLENI